MGALIESKSFVCRLCHPIREMKNHGKPEVLRSVGHGQRVPAFEVRARDSSSPIFFGRWRLQRKTNTVRELVGCGTVTGIGGPISRLSSRWS